MFVPYFLTLPAQLANWKINYLRGSGMGSSGGLHSCVFSPHRVPGSIWHTEWCCGERKDRQQEHSPCKSWAKRTMYSQISLGNHDRVKQVIPAQNWARTGAHCAYRCREASKAASALFYLADFPVSHFMAQGFVGAVYQILGGKQEGHMTHG